MGNKIAVLLVLILLAVGGFYVYQHFHEQKAEDSGEVTCKGCMTPDEKARFDKEDHGETSDGQSEHKIRGAMADDKAGFPDANAPVNGNVATAAGTTTATASATPVTATNQTVAAPVAQPVSAPATASVSAPPRMGAMPATDSQLPNAPNGVRFVGSGTYQWYRQGNLTWRLDTASGRSCIVYATMEEWRKRIVVEHGCGGSA